MTSTHLTDDFRKLHIKGSPIILYNIWDAGSALAIVASGAKAIALGSHGVANAHGYEDGEQLPFDVALANAKCIVAVTELPVTMDLETGYGDTPEAVGLTVRRVIESGIVGINLEDQIFGQSELRPVSEQVERIQAIRAVADEAAFPLFINARTDIFKNNDAAQHAGLLPEAIQRASAYAQAGADCFFVPGLADIKLIRELCEQSPLPVNIIRLPDMVSNAELAAAGAARISYGPGPYLQMIDWLTQQAQAAYAGKD